MYISIILLGLGMFSTIYMMKTNQEVSKKNFLWISIFNVWIILYVILNQGFRWQFIIIYILYGLVFLLLLWIRFKNVVFKKWMLISAMSVSIFIVLFTSILAYGFPIYDMPDASGDFLIGTKTFEVTDEERVDPYGENNDARRIKIQVWYPAETVQGDTLAFWLEDGLDIPRSLTKDWGLPNFILDQTVEVRSNSFKDAPIHSALNDYPVVVISHGWSGFRQLHSDIAEEYASQGFIAVSIDHTYGSLATVFEDETLYLNKEALPPRETTPDFLTYANTLVNTYGDDVITTINYLETLNETNDNMFYNRIDLDQIIAIGHSTGGGGVVSAALKDSRIDGIIGLDAWVESLEESRVLEGLNIPALFLRSGDWEISFNNERLYQLVESSPQATLYQVNGTTHYDFAMVYMYSPFTGLLGISGDVKSARVNEIIEALSLDFLASLNQSAPFEVAIDDYLELIRIQP